MDNSVENCTENYWIKLIGLKKLNNMEFNDFAVVDDAHDQLDDKDIAKMKASGKVKEDEEIGELVPQNVTNKQALSAVDILKRCVELQQIRQGTHLKPLTT